MTNSRLTPVKSVSFNVRLCSGYGCHQQGTNSMGQRPSVQNNSSSDGQEFPHISSNLKVHYSFHNASPSVPILSRINPFDVPQSYFHKTHLNALHCLHIFLPSFLFTSNLPHQNSVHISLPSPTCHTPFSHPHPISSYLI
jgi:hypothetical protein